jgi:hypothetical protein
VEWSRLLLRVLEWRRDEPAEGKLATLEHRLALGGSSK